MKKRIFRAVIGSALILGANLTVQASPNVFTKYFVVTAPTSTNNDSSIQNVMSYLDKGGVVGLIPTDIATNPAALDMPHILRASEIIFGPANFNIWDATNNPSGNFASENGQRLAWGLDWKDTNTFLASDISFKLWSSDPANTLRYSGNLATDTVSGVVLTFSYSLRGELWDANGNVIATYYNGESVAGHPVNRVLGLVRLGYYCTTANNIKNDLGYFLDEMPLTNFVAFFMSNGDGTTNWISSNPHLTAHAADANGNQLVTLEGQRELGLSYSLLETLSLNPDQINWFTVETGVLDGGSYTNTTSPNAFYMVH
jgi:hypothetical protein